jgi:hypothetical protein
MKAYLKFIDDLPWVIQLILALPGIDSIVWGLYRLFKGIEKNDVLLIIFGIIWIAAGWAVLWILDILSLLLNKKVIWFV